MALQRNAGQVYPFVSASDHARVHLGDVHNHIKLPDDQRKCHRAFKTSDYEQQKNVNPERAPGTCEWVIEHPNFRQWHESDHDQLLWISADPGCGKSVLSRYLVDTWLPRQTHGTVCYYFFKDNDEQSSLAPALSAILHQLFELRRGLIESCALPVWNDVGDKISQEATRMWRILQDVKNVDFTSKGPPVVCVMDALDEVRDDDRRQLIDFLCQFHTNSSETTGSQVALKFIVTSRPYDNVERWFRDVSQQFPNIRLRGEDENDSINSEINLVVRSRIGSLKEEFGLSEATHQRLLNALLEMKHRTYLWLHLAIEDIRETLQSSLLPDSVNIGVVPLSVENAYERVLSRVTSAQAPLVKTVLKVIIGARRPLTIEEMALALVVATARDSQPANTFEVNVEHVRKQIRHWCGLFVFISDSKLYLLHQTAKEFLVSNAFLPVFDPHRWRGSIGEGECEQLLANVTIGYLLLDRFRVNPSSQIELRISPQPGVRESNTFFGYCSTLWVAHFEAACSKRDDALIQKALELCSTNNERKAVPSWLQLLWCKHLGLESSHMTNVESIHVVAFIGYIPLLEAMCVNWGSDVNAVCMKLNFRNPATYPSQAVTIRETALSLAVRRRHKETVAWLIEKGAIVNIDRPAGLTLLEDAVKLRSTYIVQLLLEAGAHTSVRDTQMETPLHAACSIGEKEIAKLLLDYRADVNEANHDHQTPLHVASRVGETGIAKLLLEYGADANIRDSKHGDTILHTAIRAGKPSVARILIEFGAKIKVANGNGDTPLHMASPYTEITRILLSRGACLDCKNRHGDTAFDVALYGDNQAVATLLLRAGAQPNFADRRFGTVLEWTWRRSCPWPDVLELLIDQGECFKSGGNEKEEALMWAAAWGHYTSVAKLLQKNVNVRAMDRAGRNALDIAIDNHHQITSALLVASGAEPSSPRNSIMLAEMLRMATPLHRIVPELVSSTSATNATLVGLSAAARASPQNRSTSFQSVNEAALQELSQQPCEISPVLSVTQQIQSPIEDMTMYPEEESTKPIRPQRDHSPTSKFRFIWPCLMGRRRASQAP